MKTIKFEITEKNCKTDKNLLLHFDDFFIIKLQDTKELKTLIKQLKKIEKEITERY